MNEHFGKCWILYTPDGKGKITSILGFPVPSSPLQGETSWHIARSTIITTMSRPRKLTDEERKARKKAAHQKWRADNPEKAKASDDRRYRKRYAEDPDTIKQRNSDWQKNNLAWRREYNKQRRAKRKAENTDE